MTEDVPDYFKEFGLSRNKSRTENYNQLQKKLIDASRRNHPKWVAIHGRINVALPIFGNETRYQEYLRQLETQESPPPPILEKKDISKPPPRYDHLPDRELPPPAKKGCGWGRALLILIVLFAGCRIFSGILTAIPQMFEEMVSEIENVPASEESVSEESITNDTSIDEKTNEQTDVQTCNTEGSLLLHNSSFRLDISEIELTQTTVIFSIELTSLVNGWWSSDLDRVSEIYLETDDNTRYEVKEMYGIPTKDIGSSVNFSFLEGESEKGSIIFDKPPTETFTFHYLDKDSSGPIPISLQDTNCD